MTSNSVGSDTTPNTRYADSSMACWTTLKTSAQFVSRKFLPFPLHTTTAAFTPWLGICANASRQASSTLFASWCVAVKHAGELPQSFSVWHKSSRSICNMEPSSVAASSAATVCSTPSAWADAAGSDHGDSAMPPTILRTWRRIKVRFTLPPSIATVWRPASELLRHSTPPPHTASAPVCACRLPPTWAHLVTRVGCRGRSLANAAARSQD